MSARGYMETGRRQPGHAGSARAWVSSATVQFSVAGKERDCLVENWPKMGRQMVRQALLVGVRLVRILGLRKFIRQILVAALPAWLFNAAKAMRSRQRKRRAVDLESAARTEKAKKLLAILRREGAFVAFGSLLGLVREGRLLEHDDDMDFVYIGRLSELERQLRAENGGWDIRWMGRFGLNVSIPDVGLSVDIFRGFVDRGRHHVATVACGRLTAVYFFELARLCPLREVESGIGEVLMPADPEYFLARHYGDEWRRYDPKWTYATAPSRVSLARVVELAI